MDSIYPPLHRFGDGGEEGRSEAVKEISSKPEIVISGSSSYFLHDSKNSMATTTTTSTGSDGIVSVDNLIKNPVPPAGSLNRSSVSGKKNYTVMPHPQRRDRGRSVPSAGAGGHGEISGMCGGG